MPSHFTIGDMGQYLDVKKTDGTRVHHLKDEDKVTSIPAITACVIFFNLAATISC